MSNGFPHECRGFLAGKSTRLLAVWGSYAYKGRAVLSDVLYSPGGHGLWTPTHDLEVILWDPVRGSQLKTFPMNPPGQEQDTSVPTFGVATPDGKRLLIGRNSGLLACYDTSTGTLLWSKLAVAIPPSGPVPAVSEIVLSPDGSLCATVAAAEFPSQVRVWEVSTGKVVGALKGRGPIMLFDERPRLFLDGSRVASFESGDTLQQLDGPSPTTAVAATRDGIVMLVAYNDGSIYRWDRGRSAPIWKTRCTHAITRDPLVLKALSLTRDEQTLLSVSSAEHHTWSVKDGRALARAPFKGTFRVTYAPDSARLFGLVFQSKRIRHFDLIHETEIVSAYEHHDTVRFMVSLPDGKQVVSGSADGTLRVWDVSTGYPLRVVRAGNVVDLCYSPDGLVAALIDEQGLALADPTSLFIRRRTTLTDLDLARDLGSVCFSPDGTSLLLCSADGVVLRVGAFDKKVLFKTDKSDGVRAVFSADGKQALVTTQKPSIRVLDIDSGAPVAEHPIPDRAQSLQQVMRDGARVLSVIAGRGLMLRDLASGGVRAFFAGSESAETLLAVSLDEGHCLTRAADGKVTLWDVGKVLPVETIDLASSADRATSALFAPDGRSFYVGTSRGVVLRFGMS
ncbi:MAG: WD40 repeat domain-containing protein [Byssovorax sp.]